MRWTWLRWEELDRDRLHAIARLRQDVFVVEQDCAYADLDGQDPLALHLVTEDPNLVGYLRLFTAGVLRNEAVIGRVIVAASHRRTGLGSQLMHHAHQRLSGPIFLSAQSHLRGFYEAAGYAVSGPGYDEDGIPHLPMIRP